MWKRERQRRVEPTTLPKIHFLFKVTQKVFPLNLMSVWVGLQCDQIWRNFSTLAKFAKSLGNFNCVYLLFGEILGRLWQILYAIWKIFIDVNGQMSKNYLAIWSHCQPAGLLAGGRRRRWRHFYLQYLLYKYSFLFISNRLFRITRLTPVPK